MLFNYKLLKLIRVKLLNTLLNKLNNGTITLFKIFKSVKISLLMSEILSLVNSCQSLYT